MAGGQQQQSIDLSVLSLEQLNQMKTQHEEEVQTLSGNFMKLRDAQVCTTVATHVGLFIASKCSFDDADSRWNKCICVEVSFGFALVHKIKRSWIEAACFGVRAAAPFPPTNVMHAHVLQ